MRVIADNQLAGKFLLYSRKRVYFLSARYRGLIGFYFYFFLKNNYARRVVRIYAVFWQFEARDINVLMPRIIRGEESY